jgi:type III secretion protein T
VITLLDADVALRTVVLSAPRIGAAFLILPMLSKEDAPPLVRNAIYVALAVAVTPFLDQAGALPKDFVPWVGIIVKEIFVGAVIGFSFAGVLWAVGMVGDVIDTQVGANMASLVDPLGGYQVTLAGALLSRFANYLFLALGGLTFFLDVLLGSYVVWPVQSAFPSLHAAGVAYFARSFASMMSLAFMLAAPAIILLFSVDLALGVMNRYAPQLNVLPITMSVKAWLSAGVLLMGIGTFVSVIVNALDRSRGLLTTLQSLFS